MQKKIVIANWKMNPVSSKEASKLFTNIQKNLTKIRQVEVVACVPSIYMESIKKNSRKLRLGAQNTFPGNVGAETGEISSVMLDNLKVKYCIVGHSERRTKGESNEDVNKKVKSLLVAGINPVLCVGEKERDPEHTYLGFVKTQIEECLDGVAKNSLAKVIIAYEPIWAIGAQATRPATPEEFLEMSIFIRKVINDKFGGKAVEGVQIIYGGSTNPDNAYSFLIDGQADGFLVGRDSLNADKFSKIVEITENAKR